MRIKIVFPVNNPVTLPINCNAYLTGVIYRFLRHSDQAYASFLHQTGYQQEQRRFKLFTFSQLRAKRRRILDGSICFQSEISWYLSSPKDEFVTHLASSLLVQQHLNLGHQRLRVGSVTAIEAPKIESSMNFTCLAPVTMSTKREWNGRLSTYYCLHDDDQLPDLIHQNLRRKYQAIYQTELSDTEFRISFDDEYIQQNKGKVTQLVEYKDQKIRGIICPFQVEGSEKLLKVGYETGFGDKNSVGFGMVDLRRSSK